MKSAQCLVLALMTALALNATAQTAAPFKLMATIPLPGLHDGDFDHFAPDIDGHRLFLTGEENEKVLVLDTDANKLVHTIEDVKAPHAILYRKDLKKMFIVAGDASAVQVYDADSYKMGAEIKVSIDADSIAYDPATHYMYVVNGGREAHTPYSLISVIDTNTSKKLRDIKINTNHVEAVVLEKGGSRLFCNLTGLSAVGVMERKGSALKATWPLPEGDKANVAMAVDGADDVFEQKDADHYSLLAKVPGSFRAKTGLFVPELNRYYLAVPHHEKQDAEVRVYEIQ